MHMLFIGALLFNDNKLPHGNAQPSDIQTILQIVFTTIGALAVLLIVIAGIRYITAQGDPAKVTQAKNAILYSLIGLVIAVMADAIVSFTLKNL
jgi:hypothetical protein